MNVQPRLIKSSQEKKFYLWRQVNRLDFFKQAEKRYRVYQNSPSIAGARVLLGVCFYESGYWVFVPADGSYKMNWYFGLTRGDAVSGYLQATGRELCAMED